jgi:hypothetical protein
MSEKNRLRDVLLTGTGADLDKIGKLVDLRRWGFGDDRAEADDSYRSRLMKVPIIRLLTEYEIS